MRAWAAAQDPQRLAQPRPWQAVRRNSDLLIRLAVDNATWSREISRENRWIGVDVKLTRAADDVASTPQLRSQSAMVSGSAAARSRNGCACTGAVNRGKDEY